MRRAIVLALCLLAGCDGGNGNGGGGGGGGGGTTNQAPAFTSSATVSYAENTAADILVYKAVATDPEGASIVYGIRNGSETPFFGIKPTGEVMVVVDVPDFENPKDVDKDNVYHVVITASDGVNTTEMNLAITITDVDEGSRAQVLAVLPTSAEMTAMAGTGTSRVFVGQNTGQVYMYDAATTTAPQQVFTMAGLSSRTGGVLDRDYYYGLLGLVAAPDYASSGILYALVTTTDDHLELRRYRVNAWGTPTAVEIVLRTPIPARSTVPVDPLNPAPADALGGGLAFSSDGYLFVATGQVDNASAGAAIGARTDTLFGKILRLDVSQDGFPADPNRNYAIPPQIPGNPLNGTAALPESTCWGSAIQKESASAEPNYLCRTAITVLIRTFRPNMSTGSRAPMPASGRALVRANSPRPTAHQIQGGAATSCTAASSIEAWGPPPRTASTSRPAREGCDRSRWQTWCPGAPTQPTGKSGLAVRTSSRSISRAIR